ncbi:MAG: hypothetical protein HKN15_11380 [Xanthomonadales bacterium]|nr:hypothetical protein [Xanthomonadales bacterium]
MAFIRKQANPRCEAPFQLHVLSRLKRALWLTALMLALPFGADAQFVNQQELLGVEVLKEKSKRGSLRLGRGGARYSGIVIEVPGSVTILKRVTVQFEDRSSESFNESRLKFQNGRSDVMWFRSREQVIDRVSLLYFPDSGIHKGTEIRVYGVR